MTSGTHDPAPDAAASFGPAASSGTTASSGTAPSPSVGYDAVWTIPNAISAGRIVLIGVFAVLLANHQDGWAIAALLAAGASDFLDGYLARRWNQVTALGRILDPAADRLLTLAVVLGLAARGIIPWWLVAFLLARDVVVGAALLWGRRHGVESPQVTFVGKAATAGLYLFLPLAYLADGRWDTVHTLAIVGTVFAGVLYWVSGLSYVADIRTRVSTAAATA